MNMSDSGVTDKTIGDSTELGILRKTNVELLKAKHELKARIATLEGEAATLQSRAEKAEKTIRTAVIEAPLKKLAAEISNAPELFLETLRKDYDVDVDADTGDLLLLTKNGKAVAARDGKVFAFTHVGLYALLVGKPNETKDDRAKVYATLMKYAGASGGAGRKTPPHASRVSSPEDKQEIAPPFGLR
jgi:hypothetical protein